MALGSGSAVEGATVVRVTGREWEGDSGRVNFGVVEAVGAAMALCRSGGE